MAGQGGQGVRPFELAQQPDRVGQGRLVGGVPRPRPVGRHQSRQQGQALETRRQVRRVRSLAKRGQAGEGVVMGAAAEQRIRLVEAIGHLVARPDATGLQVGDGLPTVADGGMEVERPERNPATHVGAVGEPERRARGIAGRYRPVRQGQRLRRIAVPHRQSRALQVGGRAHLVQAVLERERPRLGEQVHRFVGSGE